MYVRFSLVGITMTKYKTSLFSDFLKVNKKEDKIPTRVIKKNGNVKELGSVGTPFN